MLGTFSISFHLLFCHFQASIEKRRLMFACDDTWHFISKNLHKKSLEGVKQVHLALNFMKRTLIEEIQEADEGTAETSSDNDEEIQEADEGMRNFTRMS